MPRCILVLSLLAGPAVFVACDPATPVSTPQDPANLGTPAASDPKTAGTSPTSTASEPSGTGHSALEDLEAGLRGKRRPGNPPGDAADAKAAPPGNAVETANSETAAVDRETPKTLNSPPAGVAALATETAASAFEKVADALGKSLLAGDVDAASTHLLQGSEVAKVMNPTGAQILGDHLADQSRETLETLTADLKDTIEKVRWTQGELNYAGETGMVRRGLPVLSHSRLLLDTADGVVVLRLPTMVWVGDTWRALRIEF